MATYIAYPPLHTGDAQACICEWPPYAPQRLYCPDPRPSRGVTDPTLKVRGVDGLRVADASVMPTMVSGNTQAVVFMIAEKAADLILQDAV